MNQSISIQVNRTRNEAYQQTVVSKIIKQKDINVRYHIANSWITCKRKVNKKLKTKKQNESIAISPNQIDESTHCFRTKSKIQIISTNETCIGIKKVAAKAKIISRRAAKINLNNLNGLIPPPGRQWFFWPGLDEWRRVSQTLFVNWGHTDDFSE